MQSPNLKFFQGKNQDFYLFYHETGTLYYKILTPAGWSQSQVLAEKTGPMFSISYFDTQVFVLYSTLDGFIMLAKTIDFNHWEKKQLLSDKKDLTHTKFLMAPDQNAFHMIYHLPTENTGVHSLIYASFENGKWANSYQIDRFLPFQGEPFFTGRLNNNHVILYYRTARNIISAREMLLSPYTMGSVNPIIQTSYPCIDLSVTNDSARIHLLYIVKGMFRCQVVYQYKQSDSISTPRVIWEEASCENCLLYQEHNLLKLMWTSAGQPYQCISENNGGSFLAVEKYTAAFPKNIIKGQFIQANPSGAKIQATEGFGDSRGGYALAVFPPAGSVNATVETQKRYTMNNPTNSMNFMNGKNNLRNRDNISAANSNVPFANSETHQKPSPQIMGIDTQTRQIDELSRLLNQRGEEIAQVNAKWKEQVLHLEQSLENHEEENQRLAQSLENHVAENQRLTHSLENHVAENQQLKQSMEALEQELYAAESHGNETNSVIET